ncbi:hypothetical protein ACQY0O_007737 [Thecaphora frezii]
MKQRSSIHRTRIGRAQIIPTSEFVLTSPERLGRFSEAATSSSRPGGTLPPSTSPSFHLSALANRYGAFSRAKFPLGHQRAEAAGHETETTVSDESEEEMEEESERRKRENEMEQIRRQRLDRADKAVAALREPLETLEAECRERKEAETKKVFAAVKGSFAEMAELSDIFREQCGIAAEAHTGFTGELVEVADTFVKTAHESIGAISQHFEHLDEAYKARQQNRVRFKHDVEQMRELVPVMASPHRRMQPLFEALAEGSNEECYRAATSGEAQRARLERIHAGFRDRSRQLKSELAQVNDLGRDEKKLRDTLAAMLQGF